MPTDTEYESVAELVRVNVKALVDHAEQVVVKKSPLGEETGVIEVRVADTDYGKVIGKSGRHMLALRTIVQAYGRKLGLRITLELLEREHKANGVQAKPRRNDREFPVWNDK